MTQDVIDLAKRGFAAYNAGDLEALYGLLHPEVVAVIPSEYPNDGVYEGPERFRVMLGHWQEAWETIRAEPEDFIVEGDYVIVPVLQVARGRGSGAEVESRLAYLIGVRDDLLAEWRLCSSADDALMQARAH